MTRIRLGAAAVLAGTALLLGACRDQGPDASAVTEIYVLESIAGNPLPLQLSDPGSHGAFVTIYDGRIRIGTEVGQAGMTTPGARLTLQTTAKIIRRSADGEDVIASGESSETYLFEREDLAILPFRMEGGARVDAPFWLEVHGRALVMHSEQDALRNWRFIR